MRKLFLSTFCLLTLSCVSVQAQYQSEGFDSPQEAASAYMEYFSENDIDGMLSCFAIESYAENFSLRENLERVRGWYLGLEQRVPNDNAYANDLLLLDRVSSLEQALMSQYITYSFAEKGQRYTDGAIGPIEDAEAMIGEYFGTPIWVQAPIENIQILTPEEFEFTPETYDYVREQINVEKRNESRGMEKDQELICQFTVADKEGVQFLEAGCYNGKWYLVSHVSDLSNMLGLDTKASGLYIPYDSVEELW